MKLEFDPDKGYVSIISKKVLSVEDYLNQPVIAWCHRNIGPIHWPKDVAELLRGDGWAISVDWNPWLNNVDDRPRTYVIIEQEISDRLITEFWMRFQ